MLALGLAVCFLALRRFGVERLLAEVREVARDAIGALEEACENPLNEGKIIRCSSNSACCGYFFSRSFKNQVIQAMTEAKLTTERQN